MTFLEYVCRRVMGPPVSGASSWHCPFCDSPHASFHVRPPKDNLRIRFNCFRCDKWGDEYDLAKYLYPEPYPQRVERVEAWQRDYELSLTAESVAADNLSSPGTGNNKAKPSRLDRWDLATAWAYYVGTLEEWEIGETFGLQLLDLIAYCCSKWNVSAENMARYAKEAAERKHADGLRRDFQRSHIHGQ